VWKGKIGKWRYVPGMVQRSDSDVGGNMEQPKYLYLIDLYDGRVQTSFSDADQLVAYLKGKHEAGVLRNEAAYALFWGQQLSTGKYWESAFKHTKGTKVM